GTELKDAAREILRSPEGDPVLAQWQYGLGRSVAWTSDAKGKWGVDLVRWDEFGRFAAQLVGWTTPAEEAGAMAATARVEGTQAVVEVELQNTQGQPRTDATVAGTLVAPDGSTEPITLKQVAPGTYQASLASPPTGSYLIQIAAAADGSTVAQQTVGLVVPYSPEYRQRGGNPGLLELIANTTGGTILERPEEVFRHNLQAVRRAQEIGLPLLLLAALLLPLDIAVRRLSLRRRDLAEARAAVAGRIRRLRARPDAPTAEPVLADLQRAKTRARVRHERRPVEVPEQDVLAPSTPQLADLSEPAATEETTAPATGDDALARLRAAKARAAQRRG
ncbi:MAG TPA: FixH family protein, partial [Herpetosiphonaceae bacterium]|nr:FixH family protein [Herpetosiphonaceae bacterium]